jgi:drug/metabolite transporter (DMT)-like permease
MSDPEKSPFPFVALLLGVVCIGSSPIFVRLAAVTGPVSAFWRVAIAGICLLVLSAARREGPPAKSIRWGVVLGGLFFAADLALWNQSLLSVPVAICTPVGNSAPLWVGLGGWLIWKRRPSAAFWTGLVVSAAGIAVLARPWSAAARLDLVGLSMALAASVFYAGYILCTTRIRSRASTLSFMTLSTIVSGIALWLFCTATGQVLTGFSSVTWMALAGLGLVSHLAGWMLINYALGHLAPELASITLLGQTVVAGLLAVPVLGELPDPVQLAGGVMVLVGIWWASRSRETGG